MKRRVAASATATSLMLAGLVLGLEDNATAQVDLTSSPQCSVIMPTKVVVNSPYEIVKATLAADCASNDVTYASWDIRHSYYGPEGILIFDNQTTSSQDFYDFDHMGLYYVEPSSAFNSSDQDVSQNTRSFVMKLYSRATISSARSGNYVTLTSHAYRYSPGAQAIRAWPNKVMTLQYRTCSSCSWRTLKTVRTSSTGKATYKTYASTTRYFRALIGETTTIWGSASPTTTR